VGVEVGACDVFDSEQGMVLVQGGVEAVNALNLGLVFGGPQVGWQLGKLRTEMIGI